MKKLILTLMVCASFAHAAEPTADTRKKLSEIAVAYVYSDTVLLNGKPTKVWAFMARVQNSPIPFMTEEGVTLEQIKSSYLTACSVVFLFEQLSNQKAAPSPSPSAGGLKKLEI